MDYAGALHRLLQLVDTERTVTASRDRVRYDLRRMEALLSRLGDPHMGIPTVHIAGTKGKGSTAAMCANVLSLEGYRTGLFTSPHMHTFRERIRLDGTPVGENEFAALTEQVWPDLASVNDSGSYGQVTMFEALTAMAFCHFRRWADFQVLEVGLGGRLDTTNLVSPQVCAVTSLSLDHTSILGDSLESIAAEKAGIIKPGAVVVTSPQRPEAMEVLEGVCRDKGASLIKVGESLTWRKGSSGPDGQSVEVHGRLGDYVLWTPLLGGFQLENVTVAVGILEVLREKGFQISERALSEGMRSVCWPCRMEVLAREPLVVCDGAHNPHSASVLCDSLPEYFNYGRVVLVVGISRDKDLEGIADELAVLGPRIIATRSRHPRAAPAADVAEAFLRQNPSSLSPVVRSLKVTKVEGVDRAVCSAMEEAGEHDLVLATGSLFVAAEARETIMGLEPELYPEIQRDCNPPLR